jgi:hypothetical protein
MLPRRVVSSPAPRGAPPSFYGRGITGRDGRGITGRGFFGESGGGFLLYARGQRMVVSPALAAWASRVLAYEIAISRKSIALAAKIPG